jgi:hypothetical protein
VIPHRLLPPSPTLHRLDTFDQAVRLALCLADDFDRCHVAALVGLNGIVRDGVVLSDAAHSIDHAVGYAMALTTTMSRGDHLTLISVIDDDPDDALGVRADLHSAWERTQIALQPSRCRDWLITDGLVVRSMAVTTSSDSGW